MGDAESGFVANGTIMKHSDSGLILAGMTQMLNVGSVLLIGSMLMGIMNQAIADGLI